MGSKRNAKNVLATPKAADSTQQENEKEEFLSEEEYRKQFEPVAPWKRKNIPDHGPLQDQQHVLIFVAVGVAATLLYEFTEYVHRVRVLS